MIVACEKCEARFQIDESRIKKEGSKVRCSLCKHVFTAYPPETAGSGDGAEVVKGVDKDLQETVALDSPPDTAEKEPEPAAEAEGTEFDMGLEEGGEESPRKGISEDIPEDTEEEDSFDFGETEEEQEEAFEEEAPEVAAPLEVGDRTIKLPSRERHTGRKILRVSVILLLILLCAATGVYFLAPHLLPDFLPLPKPTPTKEPMDLGVSRLTFPTVNGSFVESQKAGQLFVIRGMIKNDYPKTRSHLLVKGSLLDDQGKVVRTKTAYAGNILEDGEMKEMTTEEIEKVLRNPAGKENMNVDVQPGNAIPILIVFESLPDNLSEFTVEAVRSIPGS